MQNSGNRSDLADGHNDLSTDAVTPLNYLMVKSYRRVYLYIYRLTENADRQSSRKKLNRPSNFIGLSFIMLPMLVTPNNSDLMANHEGGVHFQTVLLTNQLNYFMVK